MRLTSYLMLFEVAMFFVGCEAKDKCKEGYSEYEGFCLPDHVVKGISENGVYNHPEFGVIRFENGAFYDNKNNEVDLDYEY